MNLFQTFHGEYKSYENYIKPFYKFYTEANANQSLNTLYGYLGLPRSAFKLGETDEENNIIARSDIFTIRANNTSWNFLSTDGTKYIWVIDELGNLIIGEDIEVDDQYEGHPTLTDGRPARLGGELIYDGATKKWMINLESGSYSSHVDKSSKQAKIYLKNVIANNLKGLKYVHIQKHKPLKI